MPIPKKIKDKVIRKASYRCSRCQSLPVEVCHIIPRKDGGTDDIKNLIALCPNCHKMYDNGNINREQIISLKNWWLKQVEPSLNSPYYQPELLRNIDFKLKKIQMDNQQGIKNIQDELYDLKNTMRNLTDNLINSLNFKNISSAVSGIINLWDSLSFQNETNFTNLVNIICKNCGIKMGLMLGDDICPYCGKPVR